MNYDTEVKNLKEKIKTLEFEKDWNSIMPTMPFPKLAEIRQVHGVSDEIHAEYVKEVEYAITEAFRKLKEAFEKKPKKKGFFS